MYRLVLIPIALIATSVAQAGIYYSGEQFAALPAQWRGFLLDHRALRNIAVKPKLDAEASPLRLRYRQEADRLNAKAKRTADESADLGALYIRLGDVDRAIDVLRPSQRDHPNHFAISANLGSAWQLKGDLRQAAAALEESVRLAPGKFLAFEEAHLKLVRLRQRSADGELDNLFAIRFENDKGDYEAGKIAASQMKRMPARAAAIAQQLALWFPADGALLWQLAELANAHGDFKNAAAMMEGCVGPFAMNHPALKKHRLILRDAVDQLPPVKIGMNEDHTDRHVGTLEFRSRRSLVSTFETIALPAIDPTGVNAIPWELFGETSIEKPFKVMFPKYLRELNGKQITMTGFMYPLRDDPEMAVFLFIEAPVGCWYCETPETTGIIYVVMPKGQTARYQRGLVRVVGRLALNADDPEEFLYAVKDARVGALD